MTQVRKQAKTKLALAALTLAASVLPGVAKADALAQAILSITDFKFTYNTSQVNIVLAPSVTLTSSAQFASVNATPVNGPGTSTAVIGPNAGAYAPGTEYAGAFLGSYAGGFASLAGNATTPAGAAALTDATVALVPKGGPENLSSGTTGFTQQFNVTVAGTDSSKIDLSFDAALFLRAYLSAGTDPFLGGSATATSTWSFTIFRVAGNSATNIGRWVPGVGFTTACNATYATGCTEASPYQLSQEANAFNNFEDNIVNVDGGKFKLSVNLKGGETYRFQVNHNTTANTNIDIPEPATLALVGIAVLGAAGAARRRVVKA
jgi:hypothetical protein